MLDFDAQASESDLRQALVECGRLCYDRKLLTSNDGNLSVRLSGDRVLITRARVSKGRMAIDDILCVASDGRLTEDSSGHAPSSETPMHLEVYRQRPDVRAVIHAHPVFSTALTVAGLDFRPTYCQSAALLRGRSGHIVGRAGQWKMPRLSALSSEAMTRSYCDSMAP
jgi:L-fuculose-phosphate aldolase